MKIGKKDGGGMGLLGSNVRFAGHRVPLAAACVCWIWLCLSCASPTPLEDVAVTTLSMHELHPGALQAAKAWKTDAYLVGAHAPFWVSDAQAYPVAIFDFRSSSNDTIGLQVTYDPATTAFESTWLSISTVEPEREPQIFESEWRIDSTEALQIAHSHGGADFFRGRSGKDLYLYLRLEKWQGDEQILTVWRVTYSDLHLLEGIRIRIDASTGRVVEIKK